MREGSIDDRSIHPVAVLGRDPALRLGRIPALSCGGNSGCIRPTAGLYFVWFPSHSTQLAELVGIGRGVDLILYIWVCISLIVLLNLHLKLRRQMELVTLLARQLAMSDARSPALETTNQAALTPPSQQRALVG